MRFNESLLEMRQYSERVNNLSVSDYRWTEKSLIRWPEHSAWQSVTVI